MLGALLGSMVLMNMALEERGKEKKAYLSEKEDELLKRSRKSESGTQEKAEADAAAEQDGENSADSGESRTEKEDLAVDEEKAEEKMIRVLLMTTGYGSYFHPSVSVVSGGIESSYKPEDLEAGAEPVIIPETEGGIQVASIQRQGGSPVYEGSLEIRRREEGLLLINELPLETYLEAVVPSEMPSGYEKEALKAQAICARTYAWKHMRDKGLEDYGADVDDSVSYQVYQNIPPQESTSKAVKETEGKILCQNGEPVEAYYFSTSAGVTSTNEIWGAEEPASYLKSVPCAFDSEEPWSWWQVELPWAGLEQRAAGYLGAEGALHSVSVTKKEESGAVTGLEVVTEAGSFLLDEEYAIRQFLSPEGCVITEKDGSTTEGGALLPSSYFQEEAVPGTSLLLTGGGYGHGVGMSQNGANEMAARGYTCEEILNYFIKDVEIQEISGA